MVGKGYMEDMMVYEEEIMDFSDDPLEGQRISPNLVWVNGMLHEILAGFSIWVLDHWRRPPWRF
jgi:hypothetical protein